MKMYDLTPLEWLSAIKHLMDIPIHSLLMAAFPELSKEEAIEITAEFLRKDN